MEEKKETSKNNYTFRWLYYVGYALFLAIAAYLFYGYDNMSACICYAVGAVVSIGVALFLFFKRKS